MDTTTTHRDRLNIAGAVKNREHEREQKKKKEKVFFFLPSRVSFDFSASPHRHENERRAHRLRGGASGSHRRQQGALGYVATPWRRGRAE